MKTFCITFGQAHAHNIDGITIDLDCWIEIHSSWEMDARIKAHELFGKKWSAIYEAKYFDINKKYYPRGCVLEFNA